MTQWLQLQTFTNIKRLVYILTEILPLNVCSIHLHHQCAHSTLPSPLQLLHAWLLAPMKHYMSRYGSDDRLSAILFSTMCCAHIATWTTFFCDQLKLMTPAESANYMNDMVLLPTQGHDGVESARSSVSLA